MSSRLEEALKRGRYEVVELGRHEPIDQYMRRAGLHTQVMDHHLIHAVAFCRTTADAQRVCDALKRTEPATPDEHSDDSLLSIARQRFEDAHHALDMMGAPRQVDGQVLTVRGRLDALHNALNNIGVIFDMLDMLDQGRGGPRLTAEASPELRRLRLIEEQLRRDVSYGLAISPGLAEALG
jgi:hypothetical protein